MERQYLVYILTNQRHTVFYTGVTNNLVHHTPKHGPRWITAGECRGLIRDPERP